MPVCTAKMGEAELFFWGFFLPGPLKGNFDPERFKEYVFKE